MGQAFWSGFGHLWVPQVDQISPDNHGFAYVWFEGEPTWYIVSLAGRGGISTYCPPTSVATRKAKQGSERGICSWPPWVGAIVLGSASGAASEWCCCCGR